MDEIWYYNTGLPWEGFRCTEPLNDFKPLQNIFRSLLEKNHHKLFKFIGVQGEKFFSCTICLFITVFEVFNFKLFRLQIISVRIRHADHATSLSTQKLAITSPTSGGRSVGIVGTRTKDTELLFTRYGGAHQYILTST
jgi:hypothetical protein